MKDPVTVEVARRNTPAELVGQVVHPVDAGRKRELLAHLVQSNDWRQVLVFCRTKHGANRLAQQLTRTGIEADAIHGNKAQNHRTRTLKRFKDNELRVLVATDIAARGLDIEALPHVVNFDLPHVAEDYVHRIGRTGRAGAEGEAVSLVSNEERPLMAAIERLMNRKVDTRVIAGFEPGTPSQLPREDEPRRQHQPRQHQRPQQRRPQQGRPEGRHGGRGQSAGNRGPNPGNRGQSPNRGPNPNAQRFNGQQRRGARPAYASAAALPANIAKEREAQIQEARARMAAEGEKPAAPAPKRGRYEPTLGGMLDPKRDE
jgi:ATP-dependent RNA helicase RhlE